MQKRRTDRFAVWVVDLGGPKEAHVQAYSPGGASVLSWEGTLAPPVVEPSICGGDAALCQIPHYYYSDTLFG